MFPLILSMETNFAYKMNAFPAFPGFPGSDPPGPTKPPPSHPTQQASHSVLIQIDEN